MNAENGGVPTVDIEVGRGAEGLLLLTFGVFHPRSGAHVPVGEPKFFGLGVLLLGVVDAVVRNEGFEAFVVVAGQPVDTEAAERGADRTETFTIHIRLGGNVVDGGEIVLHAEAGVVTADLFEPCFAESGQTAAVGRDDNIALCGHDLEVPTVAPELADGTLRTAFTEQESRVLFRRVEMRRIDNPAEHLLPVYGFRPAFFHVAPREVIVEPLVFFGELGDTTVFHVYGVDFIGTGERMALDKQLFLAGEE